MRVLTILAAAALTSGMPAPRSAAVPDIAVVRLPDGAVQPETVVDARGIVHLVYLAGEARAANVFYTRSVDGGRTFTKAARVNSQDGSAIATGTVRGAQIALSPGGRVHVVWNGSETSTPKPPINPTTGRAGSPLLYARSNAAATAFEPQRNLITRTTNLDGGASVAATAGGVFVGWHAHPASGEGTEDARRVWLAQSSDDGATFARERAISDPATGVCGCCGLRMLATPSGELHALYRSATGGTGRDVYALVSRDAAKTFASRRVHPWQIGACPMTTMSMTAASGRGRLLQAWETDGQVYFAAAGSSAAPAEPPLTAARDVARRKHPRIAVNRDGTVLLVWTEGTAWARGGSIAWQLFGADGSPLGGSGSRPSLPVWGFAAAVPRPDGGFTIIY